MRCPLRVTLRHKPAIRLCPKRVQKRTLNRAASMSEKCQKQTEVFPIGGALITH